MHGRDHRPGGADPIPGGSGGITFNTDNEGGWFELGGNVAIPSGSLAPSAVGLYDSGSGGGVGFWDGNFGGGITLITGPKSPWSFGFGGIQLLSNAGGVTIYGSAPVTIDSGIITLTGTSGITVSAPSVNVVSSTAMTVENIGFSGTSQLFFNDDGAGNGSVTLQAAGSVTSDMALSIEGTNTFFELVGDTSTSSAQIRAGSFQVSSLDVSNAVLLRIVKVAGVWEYHTKAAFVADLP